MAESILFNLAASVIEKLSSAAIGNDVRFLFGVDDELQKLKIIMSAIKAVLLDAEDKQDHSHQVKDWLQKLEDAMYYADDLVNELSTEALRRRIMFGRSRMVEKVHFLFSNLNRVFFMLKMGYRIGEVREKLDEIKDSRGFYLMERFEDARVSFRSRETYSFVRKEEVFGREGDRLAIVKLLMDSRFEEEVCVIPIVGIGGLGKTMLAQHVFNDEGVQEHFELRIWVCVSEVFDLKLLVEKMIKAVTLASPGDLELEQLQVRLRGEIDGKRYLLVLDDVWNEDGEKWLRLKRLLKGGAKGSKVLVTTRSEMVAKVTHTIQPYKLHGLDDASSWSLFKRVAFEKGQEPEENSSFMAKGIEIVGKCKGVPLAIKTIGGMLYFKRREIEWSLFADEELAKIPQGEDGILPTLKLSYNYLPSHLKHCFAYCRLFPKESELDVPKLIKLWMAQGFVKPSSNPNQCLEDVGYEYFVDLLLRSFFQYPIVDEWGNVKRCRIHGLMHDLAVFVAGKGSVVVDQNMENLSEKIRHVSFDFKHNHSWKTSPSWLVKNRTLRTFIAPAQNAWHAYKSDFLGASKNKLRWFSHDAILLNLRSLRTLDLKALNIEKLPSNLGELKHLRYLDLSQNKIKLLPSSTTRMPNLQTLVLSNCRDLIRLPRDLEMLVSLRHLFIYGCRSLTHMPRGLCGLTSLCLLDRFVVANSKNDSRHTGGLIELGSLNNLREALSIENLEHGKSSAMDLKGANLRDKQHLFSLVLFWRHGLESNQVNVLEDDEMALDDLRPHSNLKALKVVNYMGSRFVSWISSLTNLAKLELLSCEKCKYLPDLDELPCLKELTLYALIALEYISYAERDDQFRATLSTPARPFFPSLRKLRIRFCLNLKGWWRITSTDNNSRADRSTMTTPTVNEGRFFFPCLEDLEIRNCPCLTSMPLFPHLRSLDLMDTSFKPLQQTIMTTTTRNNSATSPLSASTSAPQCSSSPLTNLKSLSLSQIRDLESFPEGIGNMTSLQSLGIVECTNLTSLPEVIGNLSSLQSLRIWECAKLESLPAGMRHISSLKLLKIENCPILSQMCKRDVGEEWPNIAHIPKIEID